MLSAAAFARPDGRGCIRSALSGAPGRAVCIAAVSAARIAAGRDDSFGFSGGGEAGGGGAAAGGGGAEVGGRGDAFASSDSSVSESDVYSVLVRDLAGGAELGAVGAVSSVGGMTLMTTCASPSESV